MGDGEFSKDLEETRKDPQADRRLSEVYPRAWRLVTTLNICLAKIVGKYTAYPAVDAAAFQRIHTALTQGINRKRTASELGDYCQELRGVLSCHVAELLRPKQADDVDTRLSALAQVVRENSRLDDATFRELITGLLSWSATDKAVILSALTGIIRG